MRRNHHSQTAHAGQAGFSLMELLVVLSIMGMLAGLVMPRVMGALGKAKINTTEVQIDQLAAALDFFMVDNGRYPTSSEGLTALISAPAGLASWGGPYLAQSELPTDGWQQPFSYEADAGAPTSYNLYSLGADGRLGGKGAQSDLTRAGTQ